MVEFSMEDAEQKAPVDTGEKAPAEAGKEDPDKTEAGQPIEGEVLAVVEAMATKIGWNPNGELDAKAFIEKSRDIQKDLRDHINTQKSKLEGLGSAVKELKAHNERVFKAEVKQLKSELNTLKAKKKEAIEEGDVEEVEKLDGEIDGVKEAISKPEQAKQANPEYDEWIKDNSWYEQDPELFDYAERIVNLPENIGLPFKRITDLITRKTKEMFPEKFDKQGPAPSPVEGAGRKIATSKFTINDLTPNQKEVGRQFERQGIMTMKAYIADLAKMQ